MFATLNSGGFSWIKSSQLLSLGLKDEYILFILIFVGIIISYLLVQPFIIWFVSIQSTRLLSYIISSLFVIVSFFIIMLFIDKLDDSTFSSLKIALQCIAFFGIALIIYYSFQRLMKKANKF